MTLINFPGKTNLKFRNVPIGRSYGLAILVVSLDQLSKFLIEQNLGPYGSGKTVSVGGGLIFAYSKNNGAANNFLENTSWLLTFVAILAVLAIIYYYHRIVPESRLQQVAIGLLLGGTLGNLSDRLIKGGFVTDFIHLEWLPFAKNFNLADVAIRTSVLIILLVTARQIPDTQRLNKA